MARKSPKCPPTVEPNQFGCAWKFSGMFDHHHARPRRKVLLDESHGSKGGRHASSQVRMLTFDEQVRSINIESKKKPASSSSDHTSKNKDKEVWKNTMEKSLWERIKSRYENPDKKKESPSFVDRIVVLKPGRRVVECPVDVGCRCSYLQPHRSKKQTQVSFNDVRKKLKYAKKLQSIRKTRSCQSIETYGDASKPEKLSLVPFSKQREPDVFVEARRHLAERFWQVTMGEDEPPTSSSKRASRTLERVLLSSPIREPMATFGCESEETHSKRSLQTWSGSSPLKQNEDSSAGRCIEGSRLEFLSDVSSSKGDSRSDMDNDQFRENPSPVSVLESFFPDNVSSPTSTSTIESVELHIQPRRLDFEEHSWQTSSPPHPETSSSSFMEDRGFISKYVNECESNWEEFISTDCPSESSCDHKLLHDCVKEVLISLHSPYMRFFKSKIVAFSLEKEVVKEVMERVEWHKGEPMVPRTLDCLVSRDIMKCGEWIELLSDTNDIVFEVVDESIQELIMEAISDFHVDF